MGLPKSIFVTNGVVAHKKFEAFRESMGVVFDVSRPQQSGKNFYGKLESYLLGELLFADCQASGQKFERPKQKIAKDGIDHFIFQVFLKGHSKRTNSSRESVGRPEHVLIIDASQPWEAVNNEFHNLSLVVPRRLLTPMLLHEHDHHGRIIGRNNPFGEMLMNFMLNLSSTCEKMSIKDIEDFTKISTHLVASALNRYPENFQNRTHQEFDQIILKSKIKNYIDTHLADPDLTVASLADAFKISRSHFYRVFDVEDSWGEYVRHRRLELAYKRLASSRPRKHLVSDIAYSVGYSNVSAFRRAFKGKYQVSPTEIPKMETLTFHESELPQNRIWEQWFSGL